MELLLGALVSVVTQLIKKYISPLGNVWVILTVAVLSIIAGAVYYLLKGNEVLLQNLLSIFVSAGAVYAFIISQFNK